MKMMFCFLLSFLLMHGQSRGQANKIGADKIVALYWSPKKDAKIEIYKKGEKYFGNFKWIASPRKDTKNPDKSLQDRNILGLEFLSNFTYDDGEYRDGKIYDPKTGKTYDCKMSLRDGNLQVRGYIGLSLFGRTEIFEAVK